MPNPSGDTLPMPGTTNPPITQGLIVVLVVIVHAIVALDLKLDRNEPKRIERIMDVALVQASNPKAPEKPAPRIEQLPSPNPPRASSTEPPKRPPSPPSRPAHPQRSAQASSPVHRPAIKPKPAPAPLPKPASKPEQRTQALAPKPSAATVSKSEHSLARPRHLDIGALSQQISEVSAEINHSREAQAAGLRFVQINAANAARHKAANYLHQLEQRLMRVGGISKHHLSGDVHLRIAIRADGSLYKVEKIRSSGDEHLDGVAMSLVKQAAPYAQFPKELKEEADVVINERIIRFKNGSIVEDGE